MPPIKLSGLKGGDSDDFWSALATLSQISGLKFLRFLTWPIAPSHYDWSTEEGFKQCYEADIGAFASDAIRRLVAQRSTGPSPPLILFCLGDLWEPDAVLNEFGAVWAGKAPHFYAVNHDTSVDGSRQTSVSGTTKDDARFIEPWFDVIDGSTRFDDGIGTADYRLGF